MLAALPEETLKRLERIIEQRQYRRRQVIHFADQPGDYLYLLCTGRVKIARVSDQGRELTLYLLEDGSLFGETGLLESSDTYDLMAETLEDSLIVAFRRSDILAALQHSLPATQALLRLVSERRMLAENQVADLVFLEVPKRLAKLLLRLHDIQGGSKAGRSGQMLKGKLTHQELANIIGSTREIRPTTGRFSGRAPAEPKNGAFTPKLKMPPSEDTIQHPSPAGAAAIPTIG